MTSERTAEGYRIGLRLHVEARAPERGRISLETTVRQSVLP